MYKLIDGKKLAAQMRSGIKSQVEEYKTATGKDIGLAVVLVGEDPASQVYVRNKIKACEEVGIKSYAVYLDNAKDVDGFSAENMGRLCMNEPCLVACTPNGVMKMFESENIDLNGKNAVVIGRSNIVGKPMAMLLTNANATVTLCHSRTADLKQKCLEADIVVAAIGKAKFIKADMIKEGAVVIDVGMNRDENGKLCGDVDFENVKDKCSFITPVPGGVGPMTITMLMYNTYLSATRS